MKIAIFTDVFVPQLSGVVTSTLDMAKGLANKGHKVYVVAPDMKNEKEFRHKNIEVIKIPSISIEKIYPGFRLANPFNLKAINYLKNKSLDAVHFPVPLPLAMQGILFSKIKGVPLVGTFHTLLGHEKYVESLGLNSNFMTNVIWGYLKIYYNRCDLITVPSESAKKIMLENNIKGKKDTKVISNGIDIEKYENNGEKKQDINQKGKTILYFGRISVEKNLIKLLQIFKKVVKEKPKTKLMIIGDGPQMQELKEKINTLGLKNSVILKGHIKHEKLINSGIIEQADIFATASQTEVQPMTLIESQINGLPCIGIKSQGIKDIIKDGYNGFIVKNENEREFSKRLIELIENENLLKKMKNNSKKEAKKYTTENSVYRWEKELNKLSNNLYKKRAFQ